MKVAIKNITLVFAVMFTSTFAYAGADPDSIPGAGGVVVPLPQEPITKTVSSGVVVPVHAQPAETAEPVGLPVTLVEAAAEESESNSAFEAIVDAMVPEKPVQPLKNNRFSFYVSEKIAFAQLEVDASRFNVERGRVHFASLYSEQRDSVLHGGLAMDTSLTDSIRLSFGTRAYFALLSVENTDTFAAAVGAEAAYHLPYKALPLEFTASFYYAPDITTFGAADRTVDAQIDLALPLHSRAAMFAGARFLQVDTRPEDREVDNRLHIGMRWDFR